MEKPAIKKCNISNAIEALTPEEKDIVENVKRLLAKIGIESVEINEEIPGIQDEMIKPHVEYGDTLCIFSEYLGYTLRKRRVGIVLLFPRDIIDKYGRALFFDTLVNTEGWARVRL